MDAKQKYALDTDGRGEAVISEGGNGKVLLGRKMTFVAFGGIRACEINNSDLDVATWWGTDRMSVH